MIARFFLFEVRYWLRQPMVYIFLIVFAIIGGAVVATPNISVGGSGNTMKNAPFIVYQIYSSFAFFGMLLVTAFVNATAIRDFTSNTSQIIFSTPVSRIAYLFGKFCGSTFVSLIPFIGLSVGMIIGARMWWVDPVQIGPDHLVAHVIAFFILALPTVVLAAAVIFVVAVNVRSTTASFITIIVLMVGYGVAGTLMGDIENEHLAAFLDPFGGAAMDLVTKYWTVDDKNNALLPVGGVLLWNRLLWLGISLVIFFVGYLRFSFTDRKQKAGAAALDTTPAPSTVTLNLPKVTMRLDARSKWIQFWSLVRMDLFGILKGTAFIIVMSLGVVFLAVSLINVTSLYGNTSYPVTYNVIGLMAGTLTIFMCIIVTFYGGQLVWKERDARLDGVISALPLSATVNLLSKLVALVGVVLIVHLFAALTGIVTQLLNGYTRIQPLVYLTYFILPSLVKYTFWLVVAMLVHVLVNNKYLGFFVFILVFIANSFLWSALDVSSNLVDLNGSSGLDYSDMSGFDPYLRGWLFFKSYWLFFAALLVYASYLFVVRGNDTTMRWRTYLAKKRFKGSWPVAAGLGGVWVLLAGFGYYNTKMLNTYQTSDQQEALQVRYEKDYKKYEHMLQPHFTDVAYTIDLDPEARAISYTADVTLKNKNAVAVDTLYFNVPHRMDVKMDIPGAELVLNDDDLDQRMYRLSTPLAAGAEIKVKVTGGWRARGFENDISFPGLVQNGSFFNNMDLLPSIGYSAGGELHDRAKRRKHQLPPNDRMPKLSDDPAKRMQNYIMANSDWVNVHTVISTAADQIAIAPGSLKREWMADGKHYFEYQLDHRSLNFYSFMSARYEVAREKWNPSTGSGQDVDLEVYYQKEHAVNVPRMLNSMKKALSYYSTNFGPYMHKEARIIEFNKIDGVFAQAFPGTMPYSESIGFIIDLTAKEDIDMVFYVVAHEMGHQWWAHQVMGAEMQGSTMLSESMAQYSALMVMEKEYGRDHMRKFLKYEGDKYQDARGSEAIGETPLMQVENQGYIHYNKASVVLYCMREFLGEDTLNKAFRSLVDTFAYAEPPWPTALEMYGAMRKVTPDSLTYLLDDNLKYITLYNNQVTDATAHMEPDSTWTVNFKLTAEKVHADSLGRETKIPMADWMDVSVERWPSFDKKDKELNDVPLVQQRVKLHTGENTFTFHVKSKPAAAVIDPDHLFFDRLPSDNRKKFEVK